MIVIKDKVENKIEYPLERLGNVDHMIYFDIETTGFSRKILYGLYDRMYVFC